jgi:hypothetical protein
VLSALILKFPVKVPTSPKDNVFYIIVAPPKFTVLAKVVGPLKVAVASF